MTSTELIASYKNGANKAFIYKDCVEVGISFGRPTAYPWDDIVAVKLAWGLFGTKQVSLILRNGKESGTAGLRQSEALAFKEQVEKTIKETQKEPGIYFRCTCIGGSGTDLVAGLLCKAYFEEDDVQLVCGTTSLRLPISQLSSFSIDGTGRQVSSFGISGGGFGVEGALQGIGIAAFVNALTSKTTINTILHLTWPGAELFLHTSDTGTDEARLILSHVFTKTGFKKNDTIKIDNVDGIDIQIQRLSQLKESGHLTDDEYQLAKSKVLNLVK